MINMVKDFLSKKLQILYSSDHPILLKFHQFMVRIFINKSQIVVYTSHSNSNRNMEELERI